MESMRHLYTVHAPSQARKQGCHIFIPTSPHYSLHQHQRPHHRPGILQRRLPRSSHKSVSAGQPLAWSVVCTVEHSPNRSRKRIHVDELWLLYPSSLEGEMSGNPSIHWMGIRVLSRASCSCTTISTSWVVPPTGRCASGTTRQDSL